MSKRRRKSALDRAISNVEREFKKAVRKQVNKAKRTVKRKARQTTRKVSKKVAKSARSAAKTTYRRMRIKPDRIIQDMRDAGWTAKQIHERTGVSPSSQGKILKGTLKGYNHIDVLRRARRYGGKEAPPEHFGSLTRPAPEPRSLAEGVVRVHKTKVVIHVDPNQTSRQWTKDMMTKWSGKGGRKVEIRYNEHLNDKLLRGEAPGRDRPEPVIHDADAVDRADVDTEDDTGHDPVDAFLYGDEWGDYDGVSESTTPPPYLVLKVVLG